jgi:hypothetical protein
MDSYDPLAKYNKAGGATNNPTLNVPPKEEKK